METNDEGDWFFCGLMVVTAILFIFALSLPIDLILNWDAHKAEQAATFECKKAGGEEHWIDYSGERGKACMKEYTSCGPDENKPGFTACEQKFKRID